MIIKRNLKKILSLAMALALTLSVAVTASAAEIAASGGSGTSPVTLTTTNDGIGGEATAATKMSVLIPTALPMAMSDDGTILTATDCKIVNNSYGAVRVKTVTITAASGWNLTAFGSKDLLAGEKVDSNKLGFALSVGGGQQVKTAAEAATQTLISAPVDGCYMTGVGNTSGNSVAIEYKAIVTPLSQIMDEATIANVVFVIEWAT